MLDLKTIESYYSEQMRVYKRNILREYLQYKILEILFNSKSSNNLSFLGGTSLRIVHNINRFSEDLDFDNLAIEKDEFITLSGEINRNLELEGYTVEIKTIFKGAFRTYFRFLNLLFEEGLSLHKDERLMIQVDSASHHYDYKPQSFMLNKFDVFTAIHVTPVNILLSMKEFACPLKSSGRLVSIRDRNQNEMEFFYNVSGQLSAVMDTMGRLIEFEYEPFETEVVNEDTTVKMKSCRLAEVRDFSGRRLQFEYYPNGDLKYVDFEGRKTEYVYNTETNDIKKAHNLELVRDPLRQTVISLSYIDDKVTSLWVGGIGAGPAVSFLISDSRTTVTDAKGYKKIFDLKDERIESIQENPQFLPTKFTYYEEDGLLATVTYPEENSVT